jgi:hypothetical protein
MWLRGGTADEEKAAMQEALDQARSTLLRLGAIKLSWVLERDDAQAWHLELQAANEMGAPIELPSAVMAVLQRAVPAGELGPLEPGVWIMDLQTGHVARPEPRPGEGAGAPGIAERLQ